MVFPEQKNDFKNLAQYFGFIMNTNIKTHTTLY